MKIKNYQSLVSRGESVGRELVLKVVNEALIEVDAYHRIRSFVSVDGSTLHIGSRQWDLSTKRNVYLIGAGKACNAMAMAIDHALDTHLTRGIAIVKIAEPEDQFNRTEVYVGGHPLPNHDGHLATQKILDLVDASGPGDLFIAVISGGSSALMNAPISPISIEDEARTTEVLLTSGLSIYEINAVRRHISRVNGGRLAERIRDQGAELIGIGISDAVGKPATDDIGVPDQNYSSTPIGPDLTTLDDARAAINNHDLQDRLPKSVIDFLTQAGPEHETPKAFPEHTYFVINTLPDLAEAAAKAATARGIPTHILTTFLEGESRDAGTFMASLAREIQTNGRPFTAPCLIVSSGETVTHIRSDTKVKGHGGPSQELALSFALSAAAVPGACMYGMDSEGTDGTSIAAGGITDSTSAARAADLGIDILAHLRNHASSEALEAMNDVVITGNTGTNLCDLNVLYVPAKPEGTL